MQIRETPSAKAGYVMALAVTALTFALRYQVGGVLGQFATFLPFILAIILAAWFGGFWPGLMATVLGGALTMYFFFPLQGATAVESAVRGVTVLVFLVIGVLTSILSEELHAARRLLEAEQARRRENEVFNEIIAELSSDFTYRSHFDGTGRAVVESISDGFTKMLGYTLEELNALGGGRGILHPDDGELVDDVVRRLRGGETVEGEARYVAKDGQILWVRYRMRPIMSDNGVVTHVYGAGSDVTRRRAADAAVRATEEQLRLADRRKDEFLATLAHELRNPLAPVRNAIEIMQRADNAPLREEALHIIKRQVQQMVRLVDDLLDMSRITSGRLTLRRERVELATVLRAAVETSRPWIESSGHALDLSLPPESITLNGDPTRLAQIFANLLNNSAKFTPRGGRISLVCERSSDNDVLVTVRDTGIGIPKDMIPQVFDLFTQVDSSHRSPGGLGIGLTLVKLLVEMHGGAVEARSEGPMYGSEFLVRLPIAEASVTMATPTAPMRAIPVTVSPRRRILVVDDNEDAVTSLGMFLRLTLHDVRTANDGVEALQIATRDHPDVVLLDIGLPRMSGYDVARRIRKQAWGKDALLIAMTGWGRDQDKRLAKEAGFDFHLTKPVDPALLERVLADPSAGATVIEGWH